jgi:uncharacterized protein (TIGR02246 family)
MKYRISLAISCLWVTAPAFAYESPEALQQAFVDAMLANDAEGLAACYTADAVSYPVDQLAGYGPDFVRAGWAAFFETSRITAVELSEKAMLHRDDLAVAWGLFTMTVEPVAGGEAQAMQGRFMDVARPTDSGWLYIADHASMPLPPKQ